MLSARLRLLLLVIMHALPAAALFHGVAREHIYGFVFLYSLEAIGVIIGMHRGLAHCSFRTTKFFRFALALSASFAFLNPVRFAGIHRLHHQHTDTPHDPHTPLEGFWHCWISTHLRSKYSDAQIRSRIPDLLASRELAALYRFWYIPGLCMLIAAAAVDGWKMVAIAVSLPPVLLLHQASAVNYFCHKYGYRRFPTSDESRNNPVIAFLTFGEGWHNNHHSNPRLARTGHSALEVDPSYWLIRLFARARLVWDVKEHPRQPCLSGKSRGEA